MNSLETSEKESTVAEPVGQDQLTVVLTQLSKDQLLGAELFHTQYGTGRISAVNETAGELEVWFKGVVKLLVPVSAITSYPWMVDLEQFTVIAVPSNEPTSHHIDPETYEPLDEAAWAVLQRWIHVQKKLRPTADIAINIATKLDRILH